MADTMLGINLELAAIIMNGLLLCVMGMVIAFANRIDAFAAWFLKRRCLTEFFRRSVHAG